MKGFFGHIKNIAFLLAGMAVVEGMYLVPRVISWCIEVHLAGQDLLRLPSCLLPGVCCLGFLRDYKLRGLLPQTS